MNYTKGRNLFALSHGVDGYLNGDPKTIANMSQSAREMTSEFIPVSGIEAITLQTWIPEEENMQGWLAYAFYSDSDMNTKTGNRTAKYGEPGTRLVYQNVQVPETANYIRVSFRRLTGCTVKAEYGSEATEWRPAPEDALMFEGVDFMILARNSITLTWERDISSVTWYYKLQASTASPPAKPTKATPSGWTTTEPSYTEGSTNSLYICQKTTFSDGTFEYSDVSLSSAYEAAKAAYNKSVQALDAVTPIETKTYTDLIGSANDAAGASFYFAKIHPTSYTSQWNISLRVRVTAPEAYAQTVTIKLGGYGSSFSSYDAYTVRTGSVGIYYVNLYRATSAGINTNHKGHALGIGLRSSTNSTNTSYKRTVIVELLETENCTVDMLDTAVKYASIDGTGSTNYSGLTEMAVATAGQNATNNTNTHYTQYGSAVKVGTFGVKRYTLLMKDTEDTWVSFVNEANTVATTKTVSTDGHKLGKLIYSAGGAEYTSGGNTSTVYDAYPFDLRYSTNCGTTLVAYKPVYLVGTIGNDGLFYLDQTTWWTQTVPTTEDGKTYVYIGMAYTAYQVYLSTENDAYQYYEGKFRTLREVEEMKAAKSATNYMSADNTGIMVADMTDGTQYTPSNVPSGVKNAFIDNDSFDVRDGQTTLASFGESSQIGKSNSYHATIASDGMSFYDFNGNEFFRVGVTTYTAAPESNKPFYNLGKRAGNAVGVRSLVQGTENAAPFENQSVFGRYARQGKRIFFSQDVSNSNPTFTVDVSNSLAESGFSEGDVDVACSYGRQCTWSIQNGIVTITAIYQGTENTQQGGESQSGTEISADPREGWILTLEGHVYIGKKYAFQIGAGEEGDVADAIAITWDGDITMSLDTSASAGTTDGDLYELIADFGWDSEVIV